MDDQLQIKDIFWNIAGLKINSFSYPGLMRRDGDGNKVILVTAETEKKFILTYRHNLAHAELEAEVLKRLSEKKGPVPNLINRSGNWLVQEYIFGNRLSETLNIKNNRSHTNLIHNAISSLIYIQEIAEKIRLGPSVRPICTTRKWREERISSLDSISSWSETTLPKIDKNKIIDAIKINPISFVKWDSRPGNAIITNEQKLFWFDWEHCGRRAGIDDLIWFLTDEWIELDPQYEHEIIKYFIRCFKEREVSVSLERYLWIFGTIQMCGKLLKIIEYQKKYSKWMDRSYCLSFDLMGVNLVEADKLVTKAARWAGQDKLTEPLFSWLEGVRRWLVQQ